MDAFFGDEVYNGLDQIPFFFFSKHFIPNEIKVKFDASGIEEGLNEVWTENYSIWSNSMNVNIVKMRKIYLIIQKSLIKLMNQQKFQIQICS